MWPISIAMDRVGSRSKRRIDPAKTLARGSRKDEAVEQSATTYQLETLVRGDENLLAISGAYKVLLEPGDKYNPLFVYGPPSSGKSHLLYALRAKFEERYPKWNILTLPAGEFLEECEQAWQKQRTLEFRNQLWKLDALMIDDVHLLINRPSALEEIYHAFNRLVADGKQLIFTSRYAIAELTDMPLTHRSRFQSGLVVGLDLPRERLMRDIVVERCRRHRIRPSRKAAAFLSKEIRNVRELDGLLQHFCMANHGKPSRIRLEDCKSLLDQHGERRTSIGDIAKAVCDHFRVEIEPVRSACRRASLVQARQLAMFLARELTTAPLVEIGRFFGNRDHTTVLYAIRKVEEEIQAGQYAARAAKEIRDNLRA